MCCASVFTTLSSSAYIVSLRYSATLDEKEQTWVDAKNQEIKVEIVGAEQVEAHMTGVDELTEIYLYVCRWCKSRAASRKELLYPPTHTQARVHTDTHSTARG